VEKIRNAVRRCAKVALPVRRDAVEADKLLAETNVIALGNMATNPFIEQLYCRWYTLLDLKYPGKGGRVVRSLHNPYGTGHNVLLIGGSDDAGVDAAADAFAKELQPGNPLKVGWLMDMRLAEGVTPPKIGESVYGWRDSWRKDSKGNPTGYAPATFFGWNPISIQGALYYMTGRKEYLDEFKRLALPDPKNIPKALRTDDAFNDPAYPLVDNYHYRVHLVDCVWDLIEESPLFSDEERLRITNLLLAHQNFFDPKDTYCKPDASRHGMWHMVCIYTGSRYFAKYYPAERWTKRMDNVRRGFRAWIDSPKSGCRDSLFWFNTGIEPAFEFYMLDGCKEFVHSGAARTLARGLEILWQGRDNDESNRSMPISLLHKSAYMLKDGRYIWLARKIGYDFNAFRIGQSFWPPESLTVEPPLDLVGKVSVQPLPKHRWERIGKTIPLEEGFNFLSYRSGLAPTDDFFQIDGFYGHGRTPHHVSPIYILRMNERLILYGYESQIVVRRQGMVENKVPMAAQLKQAVASGDVAYVRTHVPDMTFSTWDRHLLYLKGDYVLVVDTVAGRADGEYDVSCNWATMGRANVSPDERRRITLTSGTMVYCANPLAVSVADRVKRQSWSGNLKRGESTTITNLLYAQPGKKARTFRIDAIGDGANLISGEHLAYVGTGRFESDAFSVNAGFAYISPTRVFLSNATHLTCAGLAILISEQPVSLSWPLDQAQPTMVGEGAKQCATPAAAETAAAVAKALDALRRVAKTAEATQDKKAPPESNWQPSWQTKLPGRPALLALDEQTTPHVAWIASHDRRSKGKDEKGKEQFADISHVTAVGPDGKVTCSHELPSKINTLWAANSPSQAKAFSVLVGCGDDAIHAFSANGERRWEAKAEVHPEFKIGDRYEAPWYSDPTRCHGVFDFLVDQAWTPGREEIAVGRPCTVEFRDLAGKRLGRTAVRWGYAATLAYHEKKGEKPARWLLAGKFHNLGHPAISAIGKDYKLISNNYCIGPAQGATAMNGWNRNGTNHIVSCDIDDDGAAEVVTTLSGHWNQLNVFANNCTKCIWTASFGPARQRSPFLKGLAVVDLDGDGKKEIAVGTLNGWLCVFDCAGKALWQKRFPAAINALLAIDRRLFVGCADGMLSVVDGRGAMLHAARLDGPVIALGASAGSILAACSSGTISQLPRP